MAGRTKALTDFGRDLDSLLKRAGKFTLREYADECGVSYKYLLQLRTSPTRRPGKLYIDLLKPFTRLRILDLAEGHRLSQNHRDRPLSLTECRTLFPQATEQELVESIKKAVDVKAIEDPNKSVAAAAEARSRTAGGLTSAPQGQLYRRVFVGRQAELNQLRAAFDEVVAGEGKLVMVSGEPGIGKTALCGQLATYVASRGGTSLVGHCYEPGSLSLPYLALIEALRSHVLACDAGELTRELGAGAPEVARILPEITERLSVAPRPRGDPDTEKYRLLQAVADFLGNMAKAQPLLLVLEDLHGADHGTLEMLQHVARNLAGKRLLVLGTYRDVEVDRAHPLSAALAELRRLPSLGQILLRGLTTEEVARMLSGIIGRDNVAGVDAAVHAHTEGNPLFVEEVARYLVQEGVIDRDGALTQLAQDRAFDMRIPVGLRDVIGKRLSGLSERCNRMLSVAAVIGRDFRLDTLEEVAGMPEKDLYEAIGEATRAAVLEERSRPGMTVYRFAHAFFRQTLYEEMIAPQRLRLHQHVAGSLEVLYAKHPDEHAAELAEHFSQSTRSADLNKAVSYCELAAKRAIEVYAYGDAVRWLEQGLKVQRVLDPDDKAKMCDLLLELCDALFASMDVTGTLDARLSAAFSLAESLGDGPRAVRACRTALLTILLGRQGTAGVASPEFAQWAARADRYASPGSIERVVADYALGTIRATGIDRRSGVRLLERAYRLSRDLGHPDFDVYALAVFGLVSYRTAPQHTQENALIAEEMLASPAYKDLTNKGGRGSLAYGNIVHTLLVVGNRERANDIWRGAREILERAGRSLHPIDAVLAVIDGHLKEETDWAARWRSVGDQRGWTTGIIAESTFASDLRARIYLGESLDDPQLLPAGYQGMVASCLMQAHQGMNEDATRRLDELVVKRPGIGTAEDEGPSWADTVLLEASVLVGHRRAAELLLNRLSGTSVRTSGRILPTCTARHLGGAAALLGRYDEARRHYQEAIRVCTEMRFRPELALSRLQLAELLLEQYPQEKEESLEHLDFAIRELRGMKMQPSLEQALRHKEILKA